MKLSKEIRFHIEEMNDVSCHVMTSTLNKDVPFSFSLIRDSLINKIYIVKINYNNILLYKQDDKAIISS